MLKYSLLLVLILSVVADRPKIFKNEFLQQDPGTGYPSSPTTAYPTSGAGIDAPLVDPPAGHGLPEFSDIPSNLSADQLVSELRAWRQAEEAAEEEFYEQTDAAIADAEAAYAECETLYKTEEEIAECHAAAESDIDLVVKMVEDLQTSHGNEEEVFDEAITKILASKGYYGTYWT